jgi:hypothetical protein
MDEETLARIEAETRKARRLAVAAEVLAAMVAARIYGSEEEQVPLAVQYADALLAELDKGES